MTPGRMPTIDLNADVGEGCDDAAILPYVTSANVACGGHAGDEATMRATLRLARELGVAAGAHPGFPDRDGFGRRVTTRDPARVQVLVEEQCRSLTAVAEAEGVVLAHVKPHGALYNLSAEDDAVAAAIAEAVRRSLPGARLVGLAGSRSLIAARAAGLAARGEAFVDRGYRGDGRLAERGTPGALIEDPAEAARRAVAIATRGCLEAVDGTPLAIAAETLCMHGDVPGAAYVARAVADALRRAGVRVAAAG